MIFTTKSGGLHSKRKCKCERLVLGRQSVETQLRIVDPLMRQREVMLPHYCSPP